MDVVPSHDMALWLIDLIDDFLELLGLGREAFIEEFVYVVVIVLLALFIGWFIRFVVLFVIRKVIVLHRYDIGKELIEQKVFTRGSSNAFHTEIRVDCERAENYFSFTWPWL